MKVAIIKYNAGNIQSVLFALERIGIQAIVTDNPDQISTADKVIFPGVGEASTAMNYLKERNLEQLIISLKQPVLGICLGMQLLCSYTEEGTTNCLDIFKNVSVRKFNPTQSDIKVPQVGWNTIADLKTTLFDNIPEQSFCYFVHGYFAEASPLSIAITNYIIPYSAALQYKNFYGVQFHPEKSATIGEQILKNFLAI